MNTVLIVAIIAALFAIQFAALFVMVSAAERRRDDEVRTLKSKVAVLDIERLARREVSR